MKTIHDEDLVLLFYGEHKDPSLAATVATSPELSARFDALSEALKKVDAFVPPHRGADYGAEVWQRISPLLAAERPTRVRRWQDWLSSLARPRFSLAGALSVVAIAVLAFLLGRSGSENGISAPGSPFGDTVVVTAGIDAERLLARSVTTHLDQLNLVLTQFANSTEPAPSEAEQATDMLVANRLYRQAAASQGQHKLASFLGRLEPLLIEMAYSAQLESPQSRERMQQEVRDGLLFRVRVMNQQLNKSQISL